MTNADKTRRASITERQSIAIDLLLLGESVTATAETIGVSRQTVSDWIHHHVPFIAERNRRSKLRNERRIRQFEYALDLAVEIVIQSLENGDVGLAQQIFKRHAPYWPMAVEHCTDSSISGVTASLAGQLTTDLDREAILSTAALFAIEDTSAEVADHSETTPGNDSSLTL